MIVNKLRKCFLYIMIATIGIVGNGMIPIATQTIRLPEQQPVSKPIQLFDIQAKQMIKTIPNDAMFQAEAKKWLQSITHLAAQLTIGYRSGYIVRIPLLTNETILLGKEKLHIQEVFLIYCPNKKPLLLVFSNEHKPYLFFINYNVLPFMQQMIPKTPVSPN